MVSRYIVLVIILNKINTTTSYMHKKCHPTKYRSDISCIVCKIIK